LKDRADRAVGKKKGSEKKGVHCLLGDKPAGASSSPRRQKRASGQKEISRKEARSIRGKKPFSISGEKED